MMDCRPGYYNKLERGRMVKQLNKNFSERWHNPYLKDQKLNRLLHKSGYVVTFLGTDGSGKSTLIDKISPVFSETFYNAVYYKHLRPGWLPALSQLSGKEKKQVGSVTNPHASQPSGFFGSFMRWSYYVMDYLLGYYIMIFPKKATKSCIFIFDRYYYDYFIDKRRSRLNLPNWIIRLGQVIIPEPDIILCLGADPVLIHTRKPELPLQEIERQVNTLRRFCSKHKRAVWIDTGRSIEASSGDAIDAIMKMIAKRIEGVKRC